MKYAQVNGDRITNFVEWDGKGTAPADNLRKLPDGITSEWIGKSYDAAVQAGSNSKDGKNISAKDAPEGRRQEDFAPKGGLSNSGDVLNTNMGNATMAAEHPLDPVLGSVMRTPQPEMHVAVVPATQPKTDKQARKDAGLQVEDDEFETPVDRANKRALDQEKMAKDVRPQRSGSITPPPPSPSNASAADKGTQPKAAAK